MGIVAGGTLEQVIIFEFDRSRQGCRITQLAVSCRQGGGVGERHRMIVTEISLQIGGTGSRNSPHSTDKRNRLTALIKHTQGNGAIMAAQTKARGPGWLARLGMEGGGGVQIVGCPSHFPAPQRHFRAGMMGGVAKDADPLFIHRHQVPGTTDRQVVFGIDDTGGS